MKIEKTFVCKGCGNKLNIHSEVELNDIDLTLFGKCPYCGATVQLSVIVEKSAPVATNVDEQVIKEEMEIPAGSIDSLFK